MEPITTLRVIDIFDSLQGEGYWTGTPMTFVRLSGCNAPALGLACLRWCDTPEAWDPAAGEEMAVEEVVARVRLPRLCLTGGEPLLQVDGVARLIAEAHRRAVHVHVESNGTVDPVPGFDWVTVSPKPPAYEVAAGWRGQIDELKLVVDDHLDSACAERLAAEHPGAVVSIQPEHGRGVDRVRGHVDGVGPAAEPDAAPGSEALARAVRLVMDHPTWRLSLQTHKFLGMR